MTSLFPYFEYCMVEINSLLSDTTLSMMKPSLSVRTHLPRDKHRQVSPLVVCAMLKNVN